MVWAIDDRTLVYFLKELNIFFTEQEEGVIHHHYPSRIRFLLFVLYRCIN